MPSRIILLFVLVASIGGPAAAAEIEPFVTHLDRLAPRLLESKGPPGLAVAVFNREERVFRAYGLADREAGVPVTEDTTFNIASISKPITAMAVLLLAEEGRLDLDRPVSEYFDRWPLPQVEPEGMTSRHLLSHTAGLTLHEVPEYVASHDDPVPIRKALTEAGIERIAEPGSTWQYSGGGYMLLEALVETVAGENFEQFVAERVFEPLGMKHSAYGWPDALKQLAAVPYHDDQPTSYFLYRGNAAAGVTSTAADLSSLLQALLAAYVGSEQRIIQPGSARAMMSPAPAAVGPYGTRYGLGFSLWAAGESKWSAGHDGQNTGWNGFVWTLPDTGDGIVALSNASDAFQTLRWLKCDWIRWTADISWRGLCDGRPDNLPGLPSD